MKKNKLFVFILTMCLLCVSGCCGKSKIPNDTNKKKNKISNSKSIKSNKKSNTTGKSKFDSSQNVAADTKISIKKSDNVEPQTNKETKEILKNIKKRLAIAKKIDKQNNKIKKSENKR